MDEIGRGAVTFDGLSIAWAVSEHLAGDLKTHTKYATPHHELNNLASLKPNVANFRVLVEETHDDLVLVHRVGERVPATVAASKQPG